MKYYLRGTQTPLPESLDLYLNDLQKSGLCQAENYGWHLEFIRRPPFNDALAVIADEYDKSLGILQKDGTISTNVNIQLRH